MKPASLAQRIAVFTYGLTCYAMFLGVFIYAVGFIGNLWVPNSLDSDPRSSITVAILVNLTLLGIFAVQHSGMARPAFKRWLTRMIPEAAERSTYVLFSNLAMIVLFICWQPMGGTLWNVESTAGQALIYSVFAAGWLLVLYATFLINHFDLFGLRQVWLYLRSRPYTTLKFNEPSLYRFVRHPLYVGWITLAWATPTMTVAHLLFAAGITGYILVAIVFEERDLIDVHGTDYADYRRRTPMLIPRLTRPSTSKSVKSARTNVTQSS